VKAIELKARQRVGAFLLRHGRVYDGSKNRWTQAHFRRQKQIEFDAPAQQIALPDWKNRCATPWRTGRCARWSRH